MTSQKRFRHHQENSNNSQRFRDLPPRFKRQKSSSSSPSKSTTTSEPQKVVGDTKTTRHSDSLSVDTTCATMAPRPSFSQEEEAGHERLASAPSRPSPNTPKTNAATMQLMRRKNTQPPLSPVENRHFNFPLNVQTPVRQISPGPYFGFRTNSPPISPWGVAGVANYPSHTCAHNAGAFGPPPMWTAASIDPYATARLHTPPPLGYTRNNENQAPSPYPVPHPHLSPSAQWGKPAFSPKYTHPTSTASAQSVASPSNLVSGPKEQSVTRTPDMEKWDVKGEVDYSDPDIRTIEMLRELERVADEKEVEEDSSGVDRKSLVSHHLRMLMCAVDRYTEGVDDEVSMDSRGDEAANFAADSPVSTPGPSPGPSKMVAYVKEQPTIMHNSPEPSQSAMWAGNPNCYPLWKNSTLSTSSNLSASSMASPNLTSSGISTPNGQVASITSQPLPDFFLQRQELSTPNIPGWDLWSSPSFDFCGVLSHQPMPWDPLSGTLGCMNHSPDKERKPLYKR